MGVTYLIAIPAAAWSPCPGHVAAQGELNHLISKKTRIQPMVAIYRQLLLDLIFQHTVVVRSMVPHSAVTPLPQY